MPGAPVSFGSIPGTWVTDHSGPWLAISRARSPARPRRIPAVSDVEWVDIETIPPHAQQDRVGWVKSSRAVRAERDEGRARVIYGGKEQRVRARGSGDEDLVLMWKAGCEISDPNPPELSIPTPQKLVHEQLWARVYRYAVWRLGPRLGPALLALVVLIGTSGLLSLGASLYRSGEEEQGDAATDARRPDSVAGPTKETLSPVKLPAIGFGTADSQGSVVATANFTKTLHDTEIYLAFTGELYRNAVRRTNFSCSASLRINGAECGVTSVVPDGSSGVTRTMTGLCEASLPKGKHIAEVYLQALAPGGICGLREGGMFTVHEVRPSPGAAEGS